ncbi:MAG TPA: rhodanese-like domain-containing protein [Thermoanaerobaculia bacterium]|nr:rhodanese-like domain-containing protein [Thermoanaerobaculia bacterium]
MEKEQAYVRVAYGPQGDLARQATSTDAGQIGNGHRCQLSPSWATARVPGALNLDPAGYDEKSLPADKDSLLVFYCSNPLCRKAPNAARRAKQMGYRNVHVMSAGISGWLNAKLPTESGA